MTSLRTALRLALFGSALPWASASAQAALSLGDAQRLAVAQDARARQTDLLAAQSRLRTETLAREALPSLSSTVSATYLSDVASVGVPGVRGPLQQQYDAYVSARQVLVDFSREARRDVERAQSAEAAAAVEATLWAQRSAVNDAFFGALIRRATRDALDLAIADLEERRRLARVRVDAGAALASEALILEAEIARRRQLRADAVLEERALRRVLSSLVGRAIEDSTLLVPPPTSGPLPTPGEERAEFAQLRAGRALIDARREAVHAQLRPRVALVGRGGYGRPGLNPLGRDFDTYYTVGVQLEWSPFNWGAAQREREVQLLQAHILESQRSALAASVERAAVIERARVDALEAALALDDQIVALRDAIVRETRLRTDEGEVTAAEYVLRLTEATTATLERDTRRLRLAEARARYLLTIGTEVP